MAFFALPYLFDPPYARTPMNTTSEPSSSSKCSAAQSLMDGQGKPNESFINLFNRIITVGQAIALIVIAIAALYGVGESVLSLFEGQKVQIGMLLMIFLYIEILSMVKGSRLGTCEIPIHTPIALAIVAVARYLMVDVEHIDALYVMYTSGAILLLVLSLWIVHKSEQTKGFKKLF